MYDEDNLSRFIINRATLDEYCENNFVSNARLWNGESERGFWDDDENCVGAEDDHTHNNKNIYEIIRNKALSIIEHNKALSKARVDVEDAVKVIFILFQAGTIDFHSEPEDFDEHFFFEVDKVTKKVSQLLVRNNSHNCTALLNFPIDLISTLDELKILKLHNVIVSPPKNMRGNRATGFSLQSRPLRNLEELDITYSKMRDSAVSLETQFFQLLPKLESITFRLFTGKTETLYIRNVLNDMQSSFCACRNTLRTIDFSYSMCTQDELKTLLVHAVPKLPNLVHVNVSGNRITSLQQIALRIEKIQKMTQSTLQCQNSLQILDLSWNTVVLKINTDPKEKAALITILQTFKGLYRLGNNINMKEYPPDMTYQLRMNHAGRRLVDVRDLRHKSISLSLLPFVLERAFRTSSNIYPWYLRDEKKKDPTGIYYLLRSGPILQTFLLHQLAGNACPAPERKNDDSFCKEKPQKRRKIILSKFEQ